MIQPGTSLWQFWPGLGWPATASAEIEFLEQLQAVSKLYPEIKSNSVTRDDITALINALRCNISVATLTNLAPGINPNALLAAHQKIKKLLDKAVIDALGLLNQGIESRPDKISKAAVLIPVPAARVALSISLNSKPHLDSTLAQMRNLIEKTTIHVNHVESWLEQHGDGVKHTKDSLGHLLYKPNGDSLWTSPYFIPTRVGQINPRRLACLLGERK